MGGVVDFIWNVNIVSIRLLKIGRNNIYRVDSMPLYFLYHKVIDTHYALFIKFFGTKLMYCSLGLLCVYTQTCYFCLQITVYGHTISTDSFELHDLCYCGTWSLLELEILSLMFCTFYTKATTCIWGQCLPTLFTSEHSLDFKVCCPFPCICNIILNTICGTNYTHPLSYRTEYQA